MVWAFAKVESDAPKLIAAIWWRFGGRWQCTDHRHDGVDLREARAANMDPRPVAQHRCGQRTPVWSKGFALACFVCKEISTKCCSRGKIATHCSCGTVCHIEALVGRASARLCNTGVEYIALELKIDCIRDITNKQNKRHLLLRNSAVCFTVAQLEPTYANLICSRLCCVRKPIRRRL